MPFVIPTAATATEALTLDGLNLSQGVGGAIMLRAFTPPIPKKRAEWIEAADSDGAILSRAPLVSNGEATIQVAVPGVTRDDMQATVGTIIDKLNEADKNPAGIQLVWTPGNSSTSLTFYVLSGEITEFPVDWDSGYMANQATVTMVLQCQPYGDGTPVTYTKTATAGPLVTMDLAAVPGDARENNAVLTITDASSQSRRTVEWGAEHLHYNPASPWSLVLDSDSLVTTGFAGTQTTRTGAYDPGAAGNSIITSVVASATQAVCGTGAQTHVGTFRVKARIYSVGATDMEVRFAWRTGDGPYATNDPVNVTFGDRFGEIDLGLITIPTALTGTQAWDGRVEAWANGAAETVEVDYLLLFPIDAGYGKATATYSYSPGVISARDSFTGLGLGTVLNGRTPDAGAAWATAGVATDFVGAAGLVDPANITVRRTTATVEASPRLAVFGGAMTDQEVAATVHMDQTSPGTLSWGVGVVARYVDSSNYLRLRWRIASLTAIYLELVKVIAGVETVLASVSTSAAGVDDGALRLVVFTTGHAIGSVTDATGATTTVEANDTALATAGTLASGKGGLADQSLGTAGFRRIYDNASISTPASEPIALYSGRSLQIRYDDTIRESSAGGTWGRPQSYRGSRFKVQPAGSASRTTRIAVKASRNDLDSAEDANLTDTISLNVSVTPRYSVVPRA